jgi:hypothetical protein
VIQTHRDPLRTLPSALSLMATLKWMRCARVDLSRTAPRLAAGWAALYAAQVEQRASGALPDERILDVRYQDLVADPLGTVRSLYARLDWGLSPEVERAVAAYAAAKPRGSRGVHRYALSDWGLDASTERERFRAYCERFDVAEEPEGAAQR